MRKFFVSHRLVEDDLFRSFSKLLPYFVAIGSRPPRLSCDKPCDGGAKQLDAPKKRRHRGAQSAS